MLTSCETDAVVGSLVTASDGRDHSGGREDPKFLSEAVEQVAITSGRLGSYGKGLGAVIVVNCN